MHGVNSILNEKMFKIFKDINERSKLDDKEKEQNEGKTRGYSMD